MFEDTSLQVARTALRGAFPAVVYCANVGLALVFIVALAGITFSAPCALSGLRRFLGALLPWTIAFFLVATGTLTASFALAVLLVPRPLLSALGLVVGAGVVELWRLLATEDRDLVLALTNMVISSLLLAVLSFLFFPVHQITAWLIVPIYTGAIGALVFGGWPSISE